MMNYESEKEKVNPWHPIHERKEYLEAMRDFFEEVLLQHNKSANIAHKYLEIKGSQVFMGYEDSTVQDTYIIFCMGYQFESKMSSSTSVQQRLARNYNKRRKEKKTCPKDEIKW